MRRMLENVKYEGRARNVIIFVGDGMGIQTHTMARIYKASPAITLIIDFLGRLLPCPQLTSHPGKGLETKQVLRLTKSIFTPNINITIIPYQHGNNLRPVRKINLVLNPRRLELEDILGKPRWSARQVLPSG